MIRNCSYCGVNPVCKDLENIHDVWEPIRDPDTDLIITFAIKKRSRKPTRLDKYYLAAECPYYEFRQKMLGTLRPGKDI